jgi:hypothetical protein
VLAPAATADQPQTGRRWLADRRSTPALIGSNGSGTRDTERRVGSDRRRGFDRRTDFQPLFQQAAG